MWWEGACGALGMVPHKLMAQRTSQFTQLGALPRAGGPGLFEDLRAPPPVAGLVRFGQGRHALHNGTDITGLITNVPRVASQLGYGEAGEPSVTHSCYGTPPASGNPP